MFEPQSSQKTRPDCLQVFLALAFWLTAQILPLAHGLHHSLHEDSHTTDHQCAITAAANASFESSPPEISLLGADPSFTEASTPHCSFVPASLSPLRAGRSPPSAA